MEDDELSLLFLTSLPIQYRPSWCSVINSERQKKKKEGVEKGLGISLFLFSRSILKIYRNLRSTKSPQFMSETPTEQDT